MECANLFRESGADISKRIVIGKLDLSENRDKIVAFSFPDEPEPPPPEEVCPFAPLRSPRSLAAPAQS